MKILAVMLCVVFLIAACSSIPTYPEEQATRIASCLADKKVIEYGAFWCPNCAKQKKMFGNAYPIIEEHVYIECDPRCDVPQEELPIACRGKQAKTSECLAKNIEKYPTWEFPSGDVLIGVINLELLAEKAGCAA